MKTLAQTLRSVFSALEFANVENLASLNNMLDRHDRRQKQATAYNSPLTDDAPETRVANIHYLNSPLPTK